MMNSSVRSFGRFRSLQTRRYDSAAKAPPRMRPYQSRNVEARVRPTGRSLNAENAKTEKVNCGECSVCHITFTSASHKRDHMKGKKHKKMLQKVNGEFGRCNLCDMKYQSARDCVSHLFSQTHIRNQMELDRQNGIISAALPPLATAKPESITLNSASKRKAGAIGTPKQKASPVVKKRARPTEVEEDEDEEMMCIYTRGSGKSGLRGDEAEQTVLKDSSQPPPAVSPKPSRCKLKRDQPLNKKPKKSQKPAKKLGEGVFCTNCGDHVSSQHNFCGGCGKKQK